MAPQNKKNQVWGERLEAPPSDLNLRFCSGRDVAAIPMADELLIPYDIWTNLAHCTMLHSAGILSFREFSDLKRSLIDLGGKAQRGEYRLDPAKEDVHINLEHTITFELGVAAGKKLHTGRSRNDQIATDMRLALRDETLRLLRDLAELAKQTAGTAEGETETVMPGFTHYQPAMLTTAAHWLTNWSQGLLRDMEALLAVLRLMNRSPLGAAASFGTSWPIDREYTAELLGFDGVEENTLDCIASRGEFESRLAAAISILMNRFSTISQDLILLSSPYYGMVRIHDRFATGSSIMPQKKNPDFAELIRGKAALSHGITVALLGIQKGGMSGYNRDTQSGKYLIFDLLRECRDVPKILAGVIETLTFDRKEMLHKSRQGFMNSVDVADWLARKHSLPFRECYELLSLAVKYSESHGELTLEAMDRAIEETESNARIGREDVTFLNSPQAMLNDKSHTGAPSPTAVKKTIANQKVQLERLGKDISAIEKKTEKARKECFRRPSPAVDSVRHR